MRKSTKRCLIIAMVFFVIFIGSLITGAIIGENPGSFLEDLCNGRFNVYSQYYDESFDEDYELDEFALVKECDASKFNSLQVKLGVGSVVVRTTEGDKCRIWVEEKDEKSQINVSDKNGKLLVEDSEYAEKEFGEKKILPILPDMNKKNIVVEIPDKQWKTVDTTVQCGVGKIYDLSADNLYVYVEAGNIYTSGKQVCEKAELTVDIGELNWGEIQGKELNIVVNCGTLKMNKVLAEKINAVCEMGKITFDSVHAEKIDADCSLGDMHVRLLGKREDYFISDDVELGSVDIEGYKGNRNSRADNVVNLECAMGNIDISFLEEKIPELD